MHEYGLQDEEKSGSEPVRNASLHFASIAWRYRWLILLVLIASFAVASIYLHNATYRYTAELKVTAAAQQRELPSNLTGLASLAGVSLPGAGQSTPISLYIETMHSRDVADVLAGDPKLMRHVFADQWDPSRRLWHEPQSALKGPIQFAKAVFGVPSRPWKRPSGDALQRYIDTVLTVYENAKTGVTTVLVSDPDPQFAALLLGRLNAAADSHLRRRARQRSSEYISYIQSKLPAITIAEHRLALLASLSDQEKQQMMASAASAFAAEPLGEIAVGNKPSNPKPLVVLAIATALGLAFGVLISFAHYYLRRPRAFRNTADGF